jgi:hypothetical protein
MNRPESSWKKIARAKRLRFVHAWAAEPEYVFRWVSEHDMHENALKESVWSIAIYTGDSPLSLSSPLGLENPVLRREHINDIRAAFVADPFMVQEDGQWWMFFEALNAETHCGEIGVAASRDGLTWQYLGVALREPFHLSYPCIFAWEGEYHMVPETYDLQCIQLYRAEQFPMVWKRVAPLVQGAFADATIFRHEDRWWMFACSRPGPNDELCLFHAADLRGPWMAHRNNPLVTGDPRRARPAGRVTHSNGGLIRFAQDCVPHYGTQVRAFEISELTPKRYQEKEVPESPILFTGSTWNKNGMHHLDPHRTADGRWIACVDGREHRLVL